MLHVSFLFAFLPFYRSVTCNVQTHGRSTTQGSWPIEDEEDGVSRGGTCSLFFTVKIHHVFNVLTGDFYCLIKGGFARLINIV